MDGHEWEVVQNVNGVAVYRGVGGTNDGNLMMAYVIRAPPRLCARVRCFLERDKITDMEFRVVLLINRPTCATSSWTMS